MKQWLLIGALVAGLGGTLAATGFAPLATDAATPADPVQRGKYLMRIGGCHDCHTPGYAAKEGNVPEDRWLIGDSVGYSGPWGTTYASNLRKLMSTMDENEWVEYAQNLKTRPPMPWFNLKAFAPDDLRSMYRYVRSLPTNHSDVPEYVPPDRKPATPHIVMVPQPPKQ